MSTMNTVNTVAQRLQALCDDRGMTLNRLSTVSAVPPSTLKGILYGKSKNPGIVTLKKLCDGFEITLGEFFATQAFDSLEQEIK